MFREKFKRKLKIQKQSGLYRNPPEITKREGKYIYINGSKVLNFASNDYLGIGSSSELKYKVADNFIKYSSSASSSRLVTGNYTVISQAEKKYAEFFGYEDAIFFPSGYQANVGLLSALFDKGDTVIFDKHIHASSVKGMSLSGATFLGYKHNSASHLEKKIMANSENQVAVITESLFSMDGDFLIKDQIKALKNKYNFLTIVDEAHSFGAMGKDGKGIANDVSDIATGTFGKALGLFGALVLLPKEFKEYMFNFSSPLIYSTTLPEAHAASAIDLLEFIKISEDKRSHLQKISLLMKRKLENKGFIVTGDAHILAIIIGNENKATQISKQLLTKNIFSFPARFPTVPSGKAILRISMTSMHDENDVNFFVENLVDIYEGLND